MKDYFEISLNPPVGWVIFNRPEVKNAFNYDMWATLPDILDELGGKEDIGVVIFKGKGDSFGAGADIKELLSYSRTGRSQEYADAVNRCFESILGFEKPTIAAIKGYALGGGFMIAACCDIRVASEDSKFGIPLVKLGLSVEPAGIKRLIEIVGAGRAAEFLITGDNIPLEKLYNCGFVNFIVDDPISFSEKLGIRICQNSSFAVKITKSIINEYLKNVHVNEEFLRSAFAACMDSEDFKVRAERFLNR